APSEKFLRVRMFASQEFQLIQDRLSLSDRKGCYAQTPVRGLARVADDRFGNYPSLFGIGPGISTIVVRIREVVKFQAHSGHGVIRAGYDEKPVVVELLVRNRD